MRIKRLNIKANMKIYKSKISHLSLFADFFWHIDSMFSMVLVMAIWWLSPPKLNVPGKLYAPSSGIDPPPHIGSHMMSPNNNRKKYKILILEKFSKLIESIYWSNYTLFYKKRSLSTYVKEIDFRFWGIIINQTILNYKI